MSEKSELSIQECIMRLSPKGKAQTLGAKVTRVDAANGLCTVLIEILDLEFDDIRLTAFEAADYNKCELHIPAVGSYVLIGRIEGSDSWYVSATTEVDEIRLMGKRYSLVKGEELQTQINKLKAAVELIKSAIAAAGVTAGDGGAVFKSNIMAGLASMDSGDFTQLLNNKVKHGE